MQPRTARGIRHRKRLGPAADAADQHPPLPVADWFRSQALDAGNDMAGPRFELFSMVAEAAVHGMGVGLVPRMLVDDELARGTLVIASPHVYRSDRSYRLLYPGRKAEHPPLAAFRGWLALRASM